MAISLLFVIITLLLQFSKSANILAIVPTPSFSHQAFFRPLWKEYIKRNHSLTLITTDPIPLEELDVNSQLLRQIDVSFVYDSAPKSFQQILTLHKDKQAEVYFLFEYLLNATKRQLQHPTVQELFSNRLIEFELLLVENIAPEMFVFKQRFNVPLIAIQSMDVPTWTHEYLGNAVHPILYPNAVISSNEDKSGIWERVTTVFWSVLSRKYYEYVLIPRMDEMIKEVLPGNFESLYYLQQEVDLLFANLNPVFAGLRPLSPRTVSLSGGLEKTTLEISQNISKFMEDAQEGFIYFSLGTNVKNKLLPSKLIDTFKRALRELPYKVLWKSDVDHLEDQSTNVRITKWCPQSAILRHKNIKVFVTQGGLQSLEEAILSGVPVVTIPFILDQEANAKRVVSTGIGLTLDYEGLSVGAFKDAIVEVARNGKYKIAMEKYAELVSKTMESSLEQAVWWSEYLIKFKDVNHLKTRNVAWYQYYFVDIIGVFLVLCIGVGVIIFMFCRRVLKVKLKTE